MYDVVVIGGGPGGYTAAIRASQLGGKVCLIEKEALGGVCTNVGCIPTKALVANAELIHSIKSAARFGITIDNYSIDFNKVMSRAQMVVKASVMGITKLMQSYGVDVLSGTAKLVTRNEVMVGDQSIEAKKIIIATGGAPIVFGGIEIGEHVVTSNEIFRLQEMPAELIIIGGGIIGMEFACIFASLGTKVTVVEMLPKIVAIMDDAIIEELEKHMKRKGITLLTNHKFMEIRGNNVTVQNLENSETRVISADKILFAIGRKAVFPEGLDTVGIEYDKKGIKVNDRMETNVEGVYAIGDVNGRWQLAHVSVVHGEVAAENAMGHSAEADDTLVPSCIFTLPEIASVGKAERDVIAPDVGVFPFAANGKARSLAQIEGFVKVVAKDGKLEGVHIIGPHASDLIEEAAIAMKNGLTLKQILETIHPHPTLCEAFKGAVEDCLGRAIDLPKKD